MATIAPPASSAASHHWLSQQVQGVAAGVTGTRASVMSSSEDVESPTTPGVQQDVAGFTLTTQDDTNQVYDTAGAAPTARSWQLGLVLMDQQMDAYFWRAVLIEGLAMIMFLFSTITVVCYNTDGQIVGLDSDKQLLISLVFGLSIFLLVYFTAGLSGGNLNPAVTWTLVLGKRISVVRGVFYIISQCIGAIIGTSFAKVVAGSDRFDKVFGGSNILSVDVSDGQAVFGEILCTMMLCLAVIIGLSGELWQLQEKTHMDMLLPVAVGTAVVLCHMIMIPIDGCSVNPARSLGSAVVANEWADFWVFWVGPLVGATGAMLIWEGILRPPQEVDRHEHAKAQAEAAKQNQGKRGSFTNSVSKFVGPRF